MAAPVPRRMFARAPLKNPLGPSLARILLKQSVMPLYIFSLAGLEASIWRRRCMVSNG